MEQFRRHVVRMRCHQAVRTPTISQGACAGMKSGASGGGGAQWGSHLCDLVPPYLLQLLEQLILRGRQLLSVLEHLFEHHVGVVLQARLAAFGCDRSTGRSTLKLCALLAFPPPPPPTSSLRLLPHR